MGAFRRVAAVLGIALLVGAACRLPMPAQTLPLATAIPLPSPFPSATSVPVAGKTFPSPIAAVMTPTPTLLHTVHLAGSMPPRGDASFLEKAQQDEDESNRAPIDLAQVGDRRTFWVLDLDAVGAKPIAATLRATGEHVQMWVEDGALLDVQALQESARVFDASIYPVVREAFGEEPIPGIDGDPRIVVLHAQIGRAHV